MCRGGVAWGGFGERRWAYAGERRVDLEELGMSGLGSDAALLEAEGVTGVGSHRISRYHGRTGEHSIGFEEDVEELG